VDLNNLHDVQKVFNSIAHDNNGSSNTDA